MRRFAVTGVMVLRPLTPLHGKVLVFWQKVGRTGLTCAVLGILQRMFNDSHIHHMCVSAQLQKQVLKRTNPEENLGTFNGRSEQSDDLLKKSPEKEKWIAVYRYPGIRFAVLLARAKVIQTAFAILYLPYSSYQFSMGHIDTVFFYSSAMLAVIAPITLAIFSRQIFKQASWRHFNERQQRFCQSGVFDVLGIAEK